MNQIESIAQSEIIIDLDIDTVGGRLFGSAQQPALEQASSPGDVATAREDYFQFELNCDQRSYGIKAKENGSLPARINIPGWHMGLPVTVILQNGFSSCDELSVVIFGEPSNIKIIGAHAFYQCANLESILLPESVDCLHQCAFASCSLLQQVYFTSMHPPCLGAHVFSGASEFLQVSVPECALRDYCCARSWREYGHLLASSPQNIPSDLGFFRFALNGDGESYSIFAKEDVDPPLYLSLPWRYNQKPVTVVGPSAFWDRKYKVLVIPDTIERIEYGGFTCVTNRTSPDVITSVSILERVVFSKGSRLSYIGYAALAGHLLLTEIDLPETVTEIERAAFASCVFSSIRIPKDVRSIGYHAFLQCLKLERILVDPANQYYRDIDGILYNRDITEFVAYPMGRADHAFTLPATVNTIDYMSFWGCQNLRVFYADAVTPPESRMSFNGTLPSFRIYVPDESVELYRTAAGWSDNAHIIFPKGIIQNGFAIRDRTLVQYVENDPVIAIPKQIAEIDDYALTACRALEAICVERGNERFVSEDGVLFTRDMTELIAYPPAKNLREYEIPHPVVTIGPAAFFECKALSRLYVHQQLQIIRVYAFQKCLCLSGLVNLDASENIQTIETRAFTLCTMMEEACFMSARYVVATAFYMCKNLRTLTLGPDLREFYGSLYMTLDATDRQLDLRLYGLEPPQGEYLFFSSVKAIYVPAQSIDLYKASPLFSAVQNIIRALAIVLIR